MLKYNLYNAVTYILNVVRAKYIFSYLITLNMKLKQVRILSESMKIFAHFAEKFL